MNGIDCTTNITACMVSYNLTFCQSENNLCQADHGYCIHNKGTNISSCLCLPCFTGEFCKEDKYSKNLWILSMTPIQTSNGIPVLCIIDIVLSIILFINGIVCLQTYLYSERIRTTNLGIYLIMLSIVSMIFGIEHVVLVTLNLSNMNLIQADVFAKIFCFIYVKYVNTSLIYMYIWFTTSIAIERALLHHHCSRSLSTLPGTFNVRQSRFEQFPSVECVNFTPKVLVHLLRHRHRLTNDGSLLEDILLILKKHKDFFVPYLIQVIGLSPSFILEFTMTCSTGSSVRVAWLYLIFSIFATVPFILTFYLCIYLSSVYMEEFWTTSLLGKLVLKLKIKIQILLQIRKSNGDNI
ncbi:hypothetical protein I4U23_027949 [Adineta vaga]|nr:hypothetical protein I4U23_027949 [Adineta vaga]